MTSNDRLIRKCLKKLNCLIISLILAGVSGLNSGFAQEKISPASPVIFAGDTLFYLYAKLGPYSPEERAKAIEDRLIRLSKSPLLLLDSVTVSAGETTTDLLLGDVVVMSVTDADAAALGLARWELSDLYAQRILSALKEQTSRTSLKKISLGILFALLATAVLILIFFATGRIFHKGYALLDSWRGSRIRSLKIQKLELLSADRMTDFLIGLAKTARIAVVLILLYFYLPLVFSFFPGTRGFAAALFNYILIPLKAAGRGLLSFLPNLFFILVIFFITRYVLKFIRLFFIEIRRENIRLPGFYTEWAMPTYKIVRFLVIVFAIVMVFPYLPGSDQPAFKGVSLFIGLLFSLGSAGSVANIVSGIIITYMRPFRVGDRVKIADTIGDITERTLLVTRVRTIKNVEITIPNALVLGSHIINYSTSAQERGLILHTSVTIGYDAPWRKVHELLKSAALATPDILKEPAPFILQTSLDDFYVSYELNAYTDQPNKMATIYSDLHQNIQDKFNEGGVEIMSPHYTQLREGNQTTIPENYLPKTYTPPAFRIFPLGNLFGKGEGSPPKEK